MGAYAFRHGSVTLPDLLCVQMAVRQERLGHVDAKTTICYTHLVTTDDVRVAGVLGALLDKEFLARIRPNLHLNWRTAGRSSETLESGGPMLDSRLGELA